jgi:putative endopeptidase
MTRKYIKKNNIYSKTKKHIVKGLETHNSPLVSFEKKYTKNELYKITKHNSLRKKEFLHFIKTPPATKPNNDYYTFINKDWMNSIILKKNDSMSSKIDNFTIIQNKVFNEINDIYHELVNDKSVNKLHNLMNFYNSAYRLNSAEKSKKHAYDAIEMIDTLRNDTLKNNLWKLLANINKNTLVAVGCPIRFTMEPNAKRTTSYIPYIQPFIFGIDLTIFIDDNTNVEYKNNYKKTYKKYIEVLFIKYLGINHNINIDDYMDVVRILVDCYIKNTIKNDPNNYNKMSAEDALKYNFNWEEFSKELGFEDLPLFFIATDINFLKNICDVLIKEWNTEKWRGFWIYIYLKQINKFNRDWRYISIDFFTKFVNGDNSFTEDHINAINLTLIPYNKLLSNIYKEKYNNINGINYVGNLMNDLKMVFYKIMQNNTWLEEKTRKYALLCLDNLKVIVGNTLDTPDDPELEYTDDIWLNLTKYTDHIYNQLIKLNGQNILNIPLINWNSYPPKYVGFQNFIVNAFYTVTSNTLFIPLAYIQKPFIDLEEAGLEYNLACIGFTLAHELSHSLDWNGSKYDYNGNLYDWWTEKDREKYKMRIENIKRQYEAWGKKDGLDLQLDFSINENIADIVGLYICDKYLADFQEKKQLPNIIREIRSHNFYAFFANQMKQNITNAKKVKSQILFNEHSFAKYRCNVPLSRLDIFKTYYKVKKGDGMYWSDTAPIW